MTHWAGVEAWVCNDTADGKHLVVLKRNVQSDIYIGELESGGYRVKSQRQLTFDEGNDLLSVWTGDSKTVLFSSDGNGQFDIFKQGLDQATAQPIATGPGNKYFPVFSPDGS